MTQPKTARVLVNLTEAEFEEVLQTSSKTGKHYGQIVRESYQFARHLHEDLHGQDFIHSATLHEVQQNLRNGLDLIFGNPKDVVK